jgi:dTDP-4-dehydrorhamnose 3,5-epimerase
VAGEAVLPDGVVVRELRRIDDHRGQIVELDRMSWHPDEVAAQWTLARTAAGSLRGLHLHQQHVDHLVVLEGELVVGLVDLRRDSPTAGLRSVFALDPLRVLTIPAVVVLGFFSCTGTVTLNATSHEYDPSDDLEVRFDDPDLGLVWPGAEPLLSDRDRDAPSFTVFLDRCRAAGLSVIDRAR